MKAAHPSSPLAKRAVLRKRLHVVIFGTDTAAGKLFDVLLFLAILASVALTMLDSVETIHARHGGWIVLLNHVFTLLFTVEYGLRLYCSPRPWRYARSFFGVVDLLAILPFYVGWLLPGSRVLNVVKVLRVLRIFRVLRMAQYVGEADLLLDALVLSRRKIGIFLVAVMTVVVILGSLMYLVEGPANGFASIPVAVYWAIVTLTTVGYGDISPQTGLGQAIAACIMIIGYSIIAVPTGIITADLMRNPTRRRCVCGCATHDSDARFCKQCGAPLAPEMPP